MSLELPTIAREVARRLRENDNRGSEQVLRNLGAKVIEDLVLLVEKQDEVITKAVQIVGGSK